MGYFRDLFCEQRGNRADAVCLYLGSYGTILVPS